MVKVGYPDYYRQIVIDVTRSDIRSLSPLGYTQKKFYYLHAVKDVLSQERSYGRVTTTYHLAPPDTYTWYRWDTDEWFEAEILVKTAIMGIVVVNFGPYLKVSASGEQMSIRPRLMFYINDDLWFELEGSVNSWTETDWTLKKSVGAVGLTEEKVLEEGDVLKVRLSFDYYTTVSGSEADLYFGQDTYSDENLILLPVRIITK